MFKIYAQYETHYVRIFSVSVLILSAICILNQEIVMKGFYFAANQRGFSLIEILMVVGIIAFLATLTATQIFSTSATANFKNAKSGVQMIAAATSHYFLDTAAAPKSIEDLLSNERGVQNWKGPYITPTQALDPWKNRYVIYAPGQHSELDVVSFGEDGREGGDGRAADIGSWQ
jgi:general secretion pathway protein G